MAYVGPPNFKKVARIQRRDWQTRYPSDWKQQSLSLRTERGMRCDRCGCGPTPGNPIQTDHIIALSRGGKNIKMNYRPYCKACNEGRKRGKTKRASRWPSIKSKNKCKK